MNKNKLKVKWLLGIYKVLPNYPTQEDILFDLVEFLYQKDQINDSFTISIFKLIYNKQYSGLQAKIDIAFNELLDLEILKVHETKNKEWYIIDTTKVDYLN